MANFDFLKKQAAKAVNRVSQVAEVAVEKGSEMAEIGKLKMKISGKERQIEDLYYKIGKAVYESCSESGLTPVLWQQTVKPLPLIVRKLKT